MNVLVTRSTERYQVRQRVAHPSASDVVDVHLAVVVADAAVLAVHAECELSVVHCRSIISTLPLDLTCCLTKLCEVTESTEHQERMECTEYLFQRRDSELITAFKRLNLNLSEADTDVDLKKTRHFYPLIVELGLEHLESMEVTEITERFDE